MRLGTGMLRREERLLRFVRQDRLMKSIGPLGSFTYNYMGVTVHIGRRFCTVIVSSTVFTVLNRVYMYKDLVPAMY